MHDGAPPHSSHIYSTFLETLQHDDGRLALKAKVAFSNTSYNGKEWHSTEVQKWL